MLVCSLPKVLSRRVLFVICLQVMVLMGLPHGAKAQFTSIGGSVATPVAYTGHEYIQSLNDIIDPASGALSIRLQVPTNKGRGISMPFSFNYDSNGAVMPDPWGPDMGSIFSWATNHTPYSNNGWSYGVPMLNHIESEQFQGPSGKYDCWFGVDYTMQNSDGGRYDFIGMTNNETLGQCHSTGHLYGTSAQTQYFANINAGNVLVNDRASGTIYTFDSSVGAGVTGSDVTTALPYQIEDRNGNIITQSASGFAGFIDTLGNSVLSISGFGSTGDTVTASGQTYTLTWGSESTVYPVGSVQSSINSGYCGNIPGAAGISGPILTGIKLPNNDSYTFGYDSLYGLVNKITYPNGGYVSYEWGNNPYTGTAMYWDSGGVNLTQPICAGAYDTYAITKRSVSYDGVHVALEQDYSYSTTWVSNDPSTLAWTDKLTSVTTKDFVAGTNTTVYYKYNGNYAFQAPSGVAYSGFNAPQESQIIYWDGLGGVSKSVTKVWGGGGLGGLIAEATTFCGLLPTGVARNCSAGDYTDSSTVETYYTGYGLAPGEIDVYDMGAGGPSLSTTPPSSPLPARKTINTYQTFATSPVFPNSPNHPTLYNAPCKVQVENGSGSLAAETDIYYDGQTTLCGAGSTTATGSIASVSSLPAGTHDDATTLGTSPTNFDAGSTAPRGNVTKLVKKCLVNCSGETDSITTATYDMTGQIATVTDGCGNATCSDMFASSHTTTYHYADNPTGGNPAGNSNAYLTELDAPPNGGITYPTHYSYTYSTGKLASSTDDNSATTSYTYSDPLLRLTDVNGPAGHIHYSFVDGSSPSITTTDPAGVSVKSVLDGLGHTVQAQATSDPAGTDYVDTVYNGIGSVYSVSDPYRAGATPAKTVFQYDAIGRELTATHTADSSVSAVAYSGATTTTTDEAGVRTARAADGLGQLTQVQELGTTSSPMSLTTQYSYDILGNLTQVNQLGNGTTDTPRVRNFTYDSFARLIQSTLPETGTTCYGIISSGSCSGSYDANGNLGFKTDARGVVTAYQYDELNRLLDESSSGASGVDPFEYAYTYDTGTNGKGRLYKIYSVNAADDTDIYSYDSAGRLLTEDRSNDDFINGHASATYDSAGRLSTLTYPSGRVVNYSYDAASRVSKIYSISGGVETDYLSSETFFPDGSPATVTYGDGVTQSLSENPRLQLSGLSASNGAGATLMSRSYSYSPGSGITSCPMTANNGDIWQITDNLNSSWTRTFGYDCLNRLTNAQIGSTATTYSIDSFGNMSPVAGGSPVNSFNAKNQISNLHCHISGGLTDYDAVGNQLCDTDQYGANRTYSLNSEGRISSVAMSGSGSPFEYYTYLPAGRTMKGSASGSEKFYMPFSGNNVAEEDQNGNWTDYIYAGSQKIVRVEGTDTRVHFTGVNNPMTDPGRWEVAIIPIPATPVTIQAGDTLTFRVYAHNAPTNYIGIGFTDSSNSDWYCSACYNPVGSTSDQWAYAAVNLGGAVGSPSVMVGKTFQYFLAGLKQGLPDGEFDYMIADIALSRADGTVIPFPIPLGSVSYGGDTTDLTAASCVSEKVSGGALGAIADTHYYLTDHLGTAQMELTAAGWPVWYGQFAPYGQEITDPNSTDFNYKFTGQERDRETGNDFFGARYFASGAGRFMSPDPSGLTYANPASPQSLNLYSYVQNNPLNNIDPTGMECVWDKDGSYDSEDDPDTGSPGQCQEAGGTWIELGQNGNWSDQTNKSLINAVSNIQNGVWSTVVATGIDGAPNVTTYNNSGLVNATDTGGMITSFGYSGNSVYPTDVQGLVDTGQAAEIAKLVAVSNDPSYQLAAALGNTGVYQLTSPTFYACSGTIMVGGTVIATQPYVAGAVAGGAVVAQKAIDTVNKWIGAQPGDTFYQAGPRDFTQAFGRNCLGTTGH